MSDENGYIKADELLSATTVRFCDYRVPEDSPLEFLRGRKIRLKSMTAKERAQHEDFFLDARTGQVDPERDKLRREKLVIDCAVDGSNRPLFTFDDIRKLSKVDGGLIEAIAQRAIDHNRVRLAASLEKKSATTNGLGSG